MVELGLVRERGSGRWKKYEIVVEIQFQRLLNARRKQNRVSRRGINEFISDDLSVNLLKKILTFALILIVLSVIVVSHYAYAETSKIKFFGKYNALSERKVGISDTLSGWSERILFFENRTDSIDLTDYDAYSELTVGRLNETDFVMLVVFDANKIPKSDWQTDVTIDSVELKALVQEIPNATASKTFVTASTCNDDSYNNIEKKFEKSIQNEAERQKEYAKEYSEFDKKTLYDENEMYYENATKELDKLYAKLDEIDLKYYELNKDTFSWGPDYCTFNRQPLDSVIINRQDLPNVYIWDVTSGVTDAISTGNLSPVFEISANPLSDVTRIMNTISILTGEGSIDPDVSLVDFSAAIEAEDPSSGIGANAEPLFLVTYTTEPTMLKESLDFTLTVLIPAVSIIIPAIIWFYRKTKRSKNLA